MSQQIVKINERITAQRVILISSDGQNQGEMPKYNALQIARESGYDLVEVKTGQIPTCKIMDYGKFKYEKAKAEKHKNHAPSVKEMWMKYNTGEHDIVIKTRKIKEFLRDGHKVIFGMRLSGREKFVTGAKGRFYEIVKNLAPNLTINDITSNDKAFSVTLHP